MFRRKPTLAAGDDPLLTADLPTRVEAAHGRLAYQDDPALSDALSVQELAAKRVLAERVREHGRAEQLADLQSSEQTAATVRKATADLVRTEARDLVTARRALAALRRESSPHAQLAGLYRVKKGSAAALSGVVLAMMAFSATNVQHNLAPGGPTEPLYWMSYLLEAGLSVVLVTFMVSGSAVARWGITESDTAIRVTEVALLAGSIYLNVYPYMHARGGWDWSGIAAHGTAPVAMGVALVAHGLVAKRMGAAIAEASAQMPADAEDDTAERLAALTRVAPAVQQPAAVAAPALVQAPALETEDVLAEYERELAARTWQPALEAEEPRTWQPAPEASADAAPVSADVVFGDADAGADVPHHGRGEGPEAVPHHAASVSADSADAEAEVDRPAAESPAVKEEAQVVEAAPVPAERPAPARTSIAVAPGSGAARTGRPALRPHQPTRTSPAPTSALSGAGPVVQAALALAPERSADLVRADLTELAHEVRAQRVGVRIPFDTVVRILEMAAAGETPNAIHEATGTHHKTIGNIHETALRCAANRGSGSAQVIELRKTDR